MTASPAVEAAAEAATADGKNERELAGAAITSTAGASERAANRDISGTASTSSTQRPATPAADTGPAADAAHVLSRPQRQPFSRGASVTRSGSPGAWSEATDSTGCTDTAEVVRPPPFGSWRHYSLADVSEEAMSAASMLRACHLLMQQRRQGAGSRPFPNFHIIFLPSFFYILAEIADTADLFCISAVVLFIIAGNGRTIVVDLAKFCDADGKRTAVIG